jgi:hypothetical protein
VGEDSEDTGVNREWRQQSRQVGADRGAIPVRNNTGPVATSTRRGRSQADGGAQSSAGWLLGIRMVAMISQAVRGRRRATREG